LPKLILDIDKDLRQTCIIMSDPKPYLDFPTPPTKFPKFSSTSQNIICIVLAVVIFVVLAVLYFAEINGLNMLAPITGSEKIVTQIYWSDVLVGAGIYLKTAVDFAILIGLLMVKYPGFKNRIAIENGTAFGNALGTAAVLAIWFFFKEIKWLLALMVFVAALVLFELAKGGIEHIEEAEHEGQKVPKWVKSTAKVIDIFLTKIMAVISPVLSKILPSLKFDETKKLTFWGLIGTSFTIPFILGLDDFAGYVPLFNVVNVFGFGIGVMLGHTILNILLFINPDFTMKAVKNPVVSLLGTVAFIGLAIYGLYEVANIVSCLANPSFGHCAAHK
jgi:hypothetical protein